LIDAALQRVRDAALAKVGAGRDEVHYIVIGANDGMRGDPLYHLTGAPNWHGLLFEPLEGPFESLQAAYGGRPNAKTVRKAVVADVPGGKRIFHSVPFSTTNSSFRRDVIVRHEGAPGFENVAQRIVPVEVECVAVAELAAEPGFHAPDIVLTDTEGYDFVLFKSWWVQGWRPAFLQVEIIHLTNEERMEIAATVRSAGYEPFWFRVDMFALRRDAFSPEDIALMTAVRDVATTAIVHRNELAAMRAAGGAQAAG
jgi:FkbM family methyltransferase